MIFWRKIVIFHTKYPKNVRASLRSCIDVWNKYWKWYLLEEFDDTKMTTRFQTNTDVSLKKYRNGFYFNTIRIVILEAAFPFHMLWVIQWKINLSAINNKLHSYVMICMIALR